MKLTKLVVFIDELDVTENKGVRSIENPYKVEGSALYIWNNLLFYPSDKIFKISFSDKMFGTQKNKYTKFAKEYSHKIIICEAVISEISSKYYVHITKMLDDNDYDKVIISKNRRVINNNFNFKYEGITYKSILIYRIHDLYFGAFAEMNANQNEEMPIKCLFFENDYSKDNPLPYFNLPEKEIEFINNLLTTSKYQKEINDLKIEFKNKKEQINKEQKELIKFKKNNIDLIKIIKKYYSPYDENMLDLINISSEINYINDVINECDLLSNEELIKIQQIIGSNVPVIEQLSNNIKYLQNVKSKENQRLSDKIGFAVISCFVAFFSIVFIVSLFNGDNDVDTTKQSYCSSMSDAYNKCSYSYLEGRCVCKRR